MTLPQTIRLSSYECCLELGELEVNDYDPKHEDEAREHSPQV